MTDAGEVVATKSTADGADDEPATAADEATVRLEVTIETRRGWTLIRVSGELNYRTADELRERLEQLVESGRSRIVLELSALDYCDSTGISCLISAWRHARRGGGELYLLRSPDHVLRVLKITGLERYLCDLEAVPDLS